ERGGAARGAGGPDQEAEAVPRPLPGGLRRGLRDRAGVRELHRAGPGQCEREDGLPAGEGPRPHPGRPVRDAGAGGRGRRFGAL
ncbi:MAG: hypothetical protein AVDCRST_MAG02-2790, partial [uncultured Rubrobacteraceae bacterium]